MGSSTSEISNIGLHKGQGLRVIGIKPNSPLYNNIQIYFDFIIDLIPQQQPQRTPSQILDKLTGDASTEPKRKPKNFVTLVKDNIDKKVTLKVVSTKYRKTKDIQLQINDKWGAQGDFLGIDFRRQRFDEVFQTYYPFSLIHLNSPVKKAGIQQGQFLIACQEFKYCSMNEFTENLCDRYYDKEVKDKNVNLFIYNILRDQLRVCSVLLARGWGGKGILGCQFSQGNLHRFPKNFQESRQAMLRQQKKLVEDRKLKSDIIECNGTSQSLVEMLRKNRNKKSKHLKNIKNIIISQSPPQLMEERQVENSELQEEFQEKSENMKVFANKENKEIVPADEGKMRNLQERVKNLEKILLKISEYIESIEDGENEEGEKLQKIY